MRTVGERHDVHPIREQGQPRLDGMDGTSEAGRPLTTRRESARDGLSHDWCSMNRLVQSDNSAQDEEKPRAGKP